MSTQFKSNLEILHKKNLKQAAEKKIKADLRKSMYAKHKLAKSIAKTLGL